MIKKILLGLILAAAGAVLLLDIAYQKAPGLLKTALEKSLGKKVVIREVDYRFPAVFDLRGFEIRERPPFEGEASFSADRVRLELSVFGLFQKSLRIKKVEAEDADITVWKWRGKLTHVFSDSAVPYEIQKAALKNGNFQFIDYDVTEGGFVLVLGKIEAEIGNISFPQTAPVSLRGRAELFQGRDRRPAIVSASGFFGPLESDERFEAEGIYMPYFGSYLSRITEAAWQEGYLNGRLRLKAANKQLTADADFEMMNLLFQSYEPDGALFGLKAEEVLLFLKDSSGRLRLQTTAKWDFGQPPGPVVRQAIARSLKTAMLGNLGGMATNVIQKYGDPEDVNPKKRGFVDETVRKIKDFLKV